MIRLASDKMAKVVQQTKVLTVRLSEVCKIMLKYKYFKKKIFEEK